MEVLRRCPLAIAQRLMHSAIAVSTAVLGQSHKDNVRCAAVDEQLGQLEAKVVQLLQPISTSLLMISSAWANLKVQLHLPPLRSLDLLISPGTLIDCSWRDDCVIIALFPLTQAADRYSADFTFLTSRRR